jgi:DNA-directed RNA polymerase subunit RPC12/RpoP
MDKEFDEQLCQECPNLYADRHASIMESCMGWGFDTMNGWNGIIRDLSLKLEAIIAAMPDTERVNYKCAQCKEKFGTLRFYMNAETTEMDRLIGEAEKASAVTCEYCGQPGKLRTKGWLFTLCDKCDEERPWRKR